MNTIIDSNNFEFLDPGILADGDLSLVLVEHYPGDPSRSRVPAYEFEMRVENQRAGRVGLRIGHNTWLDMYGGNIGYSVIPEFRGNHFAERACRLVLPIAKAHGMDTIWIVCNPDNISSRRTCERLGAELVDIVPIPEDHELYQQGDREGCRYRINL